MVPVLSASVSARNGKQNALKLTSFVDLEHSRFWWNCFCLATTCCTRKRTKKTKFCCTRAAIATTNKKPTRTAFMSTKLCTKSSKSNPFLSKYLNVDGKKTRVLIILLTLFIPVNWHTSCRTSFRIQHCHGLKIMLAQSAVTEKRYFSKHKLAALKRKWDCTTSAPTQTAHIDGPNKYSPNIHQNAYAICNKLASRPLFYE